MSPLRKVFFNHKEHKANTKETKKRICITTLCVLCEISLCTLWYNFFLTGVDSSLGNNDFSLVGT